MWFKRSILWLLCAQVSGIALVPSAHAFKLRYHKEISAESLKRFGYSKSAIRHVVWNNLKVDFTLKPFAPAHFDNERFEDGSKLLRDEMNQALTDLENNHPRLARKLIGRAIHGVQDFFSHSNYIANHTLSEPLDIYHLESPNQNVACDPSTQQGLLSSGYFPASARPFPWKCTHSEINKDTPEQSLHDLAVEFASRETDRFLKKFEDTLAEQVGDPVKTKLLLEQLKKISPDTESTLEEDDTPKDDFAIDIAVQKDSESDED
jgi:hypothetical protein